MRFAFTLLFLVVQAVPSLAQEPDPKIELSGPKQREAKRSSTIKIVYVGNDLKVSSNAPSDQYNLVKFLTDADGAIAILFDPDKEGIYYFACATNSNKKSAVAVHVIVIGSAPVPINPPIDPLIDPKPKPKPLDEFTKKLKDAFDTDIAAGVGKEEDKIALAAGYNQGKIDFIPMSKTNGDLFKKQKLMNESLIGVGTCPNARKVIGDEIISVLGTDASTVLNVAKTTALWEKLVKSLHTLGYPGLKKKEK